MKLMMMITIMHIGVWETFGCETFGMYHDIYLKTDVKLLADVFEKF